ncbi:hypothetical protein BTA51_25625 [Hahella sp. CCB-MM4]|uniref:DUF3187 family protein n=1 Tax=Hahella sp. (strain CCB-MM4) TaxID=1926491 RepID=UPI000B9B3193|nr:DUF3187 family protein [Hahella sp. CCB-MM4]OZG70516.1 hypothetical protein BTA51_25625 [Hahella sp. CCB-MM4]
MTLQIRTSKHRLACIFSATLISLFSAATNADAPGRYMNPLTAPILLPTTNIFGLPDLQTRELSPDSRFELSLSSHLANTYINRSAGEDDAIIDGEIMVAAIKGRWKLNEHYDVSLYVPYVQQDEGQLDNLIYDWHEWFGLPQGGRTEATNNQFKYRYRHNGQTLMELNDSEAGLGDIRLGLQRSFVWGEQTWLAQMEIKAPTGDADYLNGSGAWDASLGLGWQQEVESQLGRFSHFAAAGLSYLGDMDLRLSSAQNNWAASARTGFHWHALQWLTITAQLDTHSPLYDSDLKSFSSFPLQLTAGGRFIINRSTDIQLSMGEDLNTVVSPDFAVNAAVSHRW